MKFTKLTLLILLAGLALGIKAQDLFPVYLQLRLVPTQAQVAAGEMIHLNLYFKNTDQKEHSIILPQAQEQGQKMIYLSFYRVDYNNHYQQVFQEERRLKMKRSTVSPVGYYTIASRDSLQVPLFYGDAKNYPFHAEAHHNWPNLRPGAYRVLALYYPWDEEQAQLVYQKVSAFKRSDSVGQDPHRLKLPEASLQSNFIDLIVLENGAMAFEDAEEPGESCAKACALCKAISNGKWESVKELINQSSTGPFEKQAENFPTAGHRNVAYLYPGPDAIQSSLPSYYSRRVIFKNARGYHYYRMRWQVGRVTDEPNWLEKQLQRLGLAQPEITSDLDYLEIIEFGEY